MEITSWVERDRGFEWRMVFEKFSDALSSLKHKRSDSRQKALYSNYAPTGEISASRSSISLDLHGILLRFGLAFNFLSDHFVQISKWGLALLAATIVVASASGKIADEIIESQNYCGALELPVEDEDSVEALYKLIADYALGEKPEYNSDGSLIGTEEIDVSKLIGQPVRYQDYKVQPGDTISGISKKFGLRNISTLIAVNGISNVRQVYSGQKLKIPSMDGLVYTVKSGNSLAGISAKFGVTLEDIVDVNELESGNLSAGQKLFIPGAKLDSETLKDAMGERFKIPLYVKYKISSHFGPRIDPIKNVKSNHTGTDFACPTGTPIHSVAAGTVSYVGESRVFGLYVIITHSGGYQTLYAHMSKITAKKGQQVGQGTIIGLVGSTGYSTGPHLHLSAFKNGRLINPLSLIK